MPAQRRPSAYSGYRKIGRTKKQAARGQVRYTYFKSRMATDAAGRATKDAINAAGRYAVANPAVALAAGAGVLATARVGTRIVENRGLNKRQKQRVKVAKMKSSGARNKSMTQPHKGQVGSHPAKGRPGVGKRGKKTNYRKDSQGRFAGSY